MTSGRLRLVRLTIYFVLLAALVPGCGLGRFPGVYQINIEQGNIITQEMVDELKPGMNRRQVKFVLGTPLVKDSLNQNRWEYRYLLRIGNETLKESVITVFFKGDVLTHVGGDFSPIWITEETPTPSEKTEELQPPPKSNLD